MIDVVKLHQFRPFLGRHDGKPATNIQYIVPVQKFKNSSCSRSFFHLSSIKKKKKEIIEEKLLAPRYSNIQKKKPREKVPSCRENRRIIRGKTEKKSRVPWQLFPPFFLFFSFPHYFRYSYSNNLRSSYLSNGVIQHTTRVYNGERLIKSNGRSVGGYSTRKVEFAIFRQRCRIRDAFCPVSLNYTAN